MSSSVFATCNLETRLPRWQSAMAGASVLACALVPWLIRDWPVWVQVFASVSSTAMCLLGLRREGWLGRYRPIRIAHTAGDDWHLTYPDGSSHVTRLHGATRYFRHFVWLRFASGEALLLGRGDLRTTSFRQLQVHLRQPDSVRERVA